MASPRHNMPHQRHNPFERASPSPAPMSPSLTARPKSDVFSSPQSPASPAGTNRNHSFSPLGAAQMPVRTGSRRLRSGSFRDAHHSQASGTFAPQFIKQDALRKAQTSEQIEGENDFSGKRYVWLKDPEKTFVRGSIVEWQEDDQLLVQCDDGSQRTVDSADVDQVNPAKFDKASDMAELTYLNEASVVHNLQARYQADLIYTYSGLFLVAVNPYCPIPIYTREYINMYRGMAREETKPHIFAVADEAFRNLVEAGENQSILVTGESGAGKTENTKKVIQYLAAVASSEGHRRKSGSKALSNLSQQILQANPILEAFGNAQTVRNNNSSRFGKFIRIQFTRAGQIAGAYIDWYLLEKSRVVNINDSERNYHIFYQLLRGADKTLKRDLLLTDKDVEDFEYTAHGNEAINGVSDNEEWNALIQAFHIMEFSQQDQLAVLRSVAAVLHLGNIRVAKQSMHADQASLDAEGVAQAAKACLLLGVDTDSFVKALLHPRVKAGREWVTKVQTPEQVRLSIDALAKGIYERCFGDLVSRINKRLNISSTVSEDTFFVGVLDIAGFEIFEDNSFEQLCINYTNEKLQQFFNHHMFVLEQEEYAREQIEWSFIDFGKDLQPTIDLIELSNPIGIFSCLDEDSVMPKATDNSFTDKLHGLWDRKTPKYKRSMLTQGFMLTHYAADVEYNTEGWLQKNKDPLNDNATRLLADSTDKHVGRLFSDCAEPEDDIGATRSRVKKGLFRTVAQRHKEQLAGLMAQLHSTHPHFVRCILPNHKKRPKTWDAGLVLDQLRCNGVLEGIRIARTGFPNRIPFAEFRSRYEVLCTKMPRGYLEGQTAAKIILEQLHLDRSVYRVGLTKVFFRAGVLAELEEQRDCLIREIMSRFQSVGRGYVVRRAANKVLYRAEAAKVIQHNFRVYMDLQANPWYRLLQRMRPLLGATRQSGEIKKREETIRQLQGKMQEEASHRQKLDEDRRRAESEIQRVQQTLESERALALDKDEIFLRLQDREAELSEKLAGALDDQEKLEAEMDEVLAANQKTKDTVGSLRRDLEQASVLISNLEQEKRSLSANLFTQDTELATLYEARSRVTDNEERLGQEVTMLKSQLDLKDRKVTNLEAKRANEERLREEARGLKNQLNVKDCRLRDLEARGEDQQRLIQQVRSLNLQMGVKDRTIEDMEQRNAQLEQELNDARDNTRTTEAEERLAEEVHVLKSQLGLKDRKIHDLQGRDADEGLTAQLAATSQELQASRRQARELLEEQRTLHQKLNEAATASAEYAHDLGQRDNELADLREENDQLAEDYRQAQDHMAETDDYEEMLRLRDNEVSILRDENEQFKSDRDMYKSRADEYYNKLEQAELAVLRAARAEEFAKTQSREAEESRSRVVAERKQVDATVDELQRKVREFEARTEDMAVELQSLQQSKKRLQNELGDYRSQRAADLEGQESSIEQTRRKYQSELSGLTGDLENERQSAVTVREENGRLRDELDSLRTKWDDEIMNSSTWWQEKSRMETTLESLSSAREDAVNAADEAQSKIISLQAEIRTLQASVESKEADRDNIAREKKGLQLRLERASDRLEELARSESPSMRNAAGTDHELLRLKTDLAQQEDIASAAVGKMRRSEALVQEIQREVNAEREINMRLHKDKAGLDKTIKDLQLRLVDLETKGYSSASQDVRFLHGRIQELESQLESHEATRAMHDRSQRTIDRTVRDLQDQLSRRDRTNAQLTADVSKVQDKASDLLSTVEELQSSDSASQLAARRAERELRESRERCLRIEKELEGWKGLRLDAAAGPDGSGIGANLRRVGSFRSGSALSDIGMNGANRGSVGLSGVDENAPTKSSTWGKGSIRPGHRRGGSETPQPRALPEVPQRKSSLERKESKTKGFL